MLKFIVTVRPGCILTLLKVSKCNLVAHATINKKTRHCANNDNCSEVINKQININRSIKTVLSKAKSLFVYVYCCGASRLHFDTTQSVRIN